MAGEEQKRIRGEEYFREFNSREGRRTDESKERDNMIE